VVGRPLTQVMTINGIGAVLGSRQLNLHCINITFILVRSHNCIFEDVEPFVEPGFGLILLILVNLARMLGVTPILT
jgi:hypothetical protein